MNRRIGPPEAARSRHPYARHVEAANGDHIFLAQVQKLDTCHR
jgi:hypothetical protein